MGDVIQYLGAVDWRTLALGAAIGAITGSLTLLFRTVIQQPVKALTEQNRVITWIWRLSSQAPFKGDWEVVWKVESDRYPTDNIDTVRIRRLFSNVTFTSIATLNDGSTQKCVFVGKLLNGSVTGRWFNPEDQERAYFGAFQFRIHGSLRTGAGVWIGWRNDGTVATGELILTRVD